MATSELKRSVAELEVANEGILEAFARALDLREGQPAGHTLRVATMAVRLGERLGLEGAALEQLRYGAVLHDVGMLGVPDSIVRKKGLLDNEETAIMRQHTVYGYELLSPVAFLHGAVDVTLHHHERWDGRGYPGGLKETEIPRAARIFAVIDIWDALLSPRPQRPAWASEQTLAYVQSMAGSHCDPEVVKAFVEGKVWEER